MQNKRIYIKPILESETFVPQNYIAACGDINKVYKFRCDAGDGRSGDVYLETNGKPGLQTEPSLIGWYWADQYLSGYHACGITHEAKTTDAFYDGYYVTKRDEIPVKVWRGPNNDNTHCTENINMDSWETEKS